MPRRSLHRLALLMPCVASVASAQDGSPAVAPGSTPAAASAAPATPPADRDAEQDARIEALTSDITRLKESMVIPETEAMRSRFGLGPAASKVYGRPVGLSLGGYGEFYLGHALGDDETRKPHSGDVYRFITYVGYKFAEKVVMNTEIEFEHATTSANPQNDEAGSVSVEFSYLDFLISPYLNVRAGLMLMPVGLTNEMHEPTTYRGNFRPTLERQVIPTTWREAGVGVHGETEFGLSYKAYLVSGLSATGFGDTGVRGGRQSGNHFVWEDKAFVVRADYAYDDILLVGGSFYRGGADQDPKGDAEVTHTLFEGHALARLGGAEVRAVFARGMTEGAADTVPEATQGFYVEGMYDIMPHLSAGTTMGLRPFLRMEKLNLNEKMADGVTAAEKHDIAKFTGGVEFLPVSDVVIKAEFDRQTTADGDAEPVQEIRLGAGFVF
ncbi:OprO/OprP family phosphate-selective porin [Myxococcota bacterium]|nr:OprO/OprP family phosphate-selective porin [Myxococcota bacterium]